MIIRESVQGVNYYMDERTEAIRYPQSRKDNRIKAEWAYAQNEKLDFPLHLIIEPTNRCNLKCPMCNRQVMTRPLQDMDLKFYKKLIDEAAGKIYSISLYALGEPMLHKDIIEMIRYAKEKGIPYVDLSTNATMDITPLIGTQLNEVILSVDGFAEKYEQIRTPAKYEKTTNNIEDFLSKKKRNEFPITRIQAIGDMIPDELQQFIHFWIDKADVVYIKKLETMSANLELISKDDLTNRLKCRKPCKLLSFSLTVNSSGEFAYCPHDPKGETIIKAETIEEAWDIVNKIAQHQREGVYTDICSRCADFENW